MNLQFGPEAPAALRLAASAILFAHIGGGAVGLVSGAVAILARKGERLHRVAGTVFFVAMLTMAGIGATVSPFLDTEQWTNTTAGAFTFYLVATAWVTVRRAEGRVGRFEVGALLVAVGLAVNGLALAAATVQAGKPLSISVIYVFAIVAAIAAAGDLGMIRRGGIAGPPRIARHLWRMCLALFIASGSFFFGQSKFLPEVLRGSPVLFVPVLAPLVLMAFWMLRVHFTRAFRSAPAPA
jgi:hypothetical protein